MHGEGCCSSSFRLPRIQTHVDHSVHIESNLKDHFVATQNVNWIFSIVFCLINRLYCNTPINSVPQNVFERHLQYLDQFVKPRESERVFRGRLQVGWRIQRNIEEFLDHFYSDLTVTLLEWWCLGNPNGGPNMVRKKYWPLFNKSWMKFNQILKIGTVISFIIASFLYIIMFQKFSNLYIIFWCFRKFDLQIFLSYVYHISIIFLSSISTSLSLTIAEEDPGTSWLLRRSSHSSQPHPHGNRGP